MKLVLIRHAQSLRNVQRGGRPFYDVGQKKIGLPNHLIPVTKEGRLQAEKVAHALFRGLLCGKYTTPSVIFHSGFVRTIDTANIILTIFKGMGTGGRFNKTPLEQNHLLRERDAGHTFEMDYEEAKTNFPHLDDYWKLDGKWFAVPLGGESLVQVMDRVSLFLNQLIQRLEWEDSTIYAVTHGGTMMAFEMVIKKIPFEKATELVQTPKNCGVREYDYEDGVWKEAS